MLFYAGGIPQGKWTKMDPIPGAITVNIGNMLMRLSDNKLKSTYHRVRALEEGETSVRAFVVMAADALPPFRVEVHPPHHLLDLTQTVSCMMASTI